MSVIFRTNYASCSKVLDEPVWKPSGLHASSAGDRVILVEDPLGVHGKVIRFRVDGGGRDNVFNTPSADRSEVMTGRTFREGDQIVLATRILLKDYHSRSGQWNVMPFDCHDANPGGTQSPIMAYVENDSQDGVRIWGGPPNSGNGLTGTIRRDDLRGYTWPDRNGWVDYVMRVKFSPDPSVGLWSLWLGGKSIWDVKAATIVRGHGSYVKHGLYRATTPLTSMYYATDLGCFTSTDEAFAFLGGAVVTPPVPQPVFQAQSAIQRGDTVAAGAAWLVSCDVGAEKIDFLFNGSLLGTDLVAEAQSPMSETYSSTIPVGASGAATLGYTVFGANNAVLKTVPAFEITVQGTAPAPAPSAAAQASIEAVRAANPRIAAMGQAILDFAEAR